MRHKCFQLSKKETKFDGLRLNELTITSIILTKARSNERNSRSSDKWDDILNIFVRSIFYLTI